jgi:hypothetical protein
MNRLSHPASPFRLFNLFFGLMLAALLGACGGGKGQVGLPTGTALFTNAPASVTVAAGASTSYTVGGGTPLYSVSTSNRDIATVTLRGTTFTMTGVAAGTVSISVTDAVGASLSVPVTVTAAAGGGANPTQLFSTAPSTLTLAVGVSGAYTVGGGKAPYAVSSNNAAVARAAISGSALAITGVAAGSAQVLVTDADGAQLSVAVTVGSGAAVPALFTTAPDNISLLPGTSAAFIVGGGAPGYTATSANAGIATATLTGTALNVSALAAGSTAIRVVDLLGDAVTINVTVAQVATPVIELLPSNATGNVGDVLQFLVNGGVPGYTVTVNNTSVASVAPASVAASGGTFSLRLLNVGTTLATIVDARGQSSTLPITVGQLSATLRVSPSALLVGENSLEVIDLNIYGGTAPYRVLTSDLRLSSVTVNGSIMSVGLGQNGNRCIASTDEQGVYIPSGTYDVTVTAIDSLGASATAIMTLKDNGLGLNQACP